jgi:hypothetical protein
MDAQARLSTQVSNCRTFPSLRETSETLHDVQRGARKGPHRAATARKGIFGQSGDKSSRPEKEENAMPSKLFRAFCVQAWALAHLCCRTTAIMALEVLLVFSHALLPKMLAFLEV